MALIKVPKRAFDAKVMLQSIRLARALGRPLGRPRALLDFEVELTRLLGLFDRDHYLSQVDAARLGGLTRCGTTWNTATRPACRPAPC